MAISIDRDWEVTPAMQADLTDRLWDIADLVALVDANEPATKKRGPWTCPAFVPLRLLTYAAFTSKAKGLFQPSDECRLTGL